MLITIHWNWHVNRKKRSVCEAQTVAALPRANEEPAGGGAEKTDNVGVMFISCCVPIALQGLTLTSGINLFPSNVPVKLVCGMKGQQLHLHILLPLSNVLARHQDYDLWILALHCCWWLFSDWWLTVPWLPIIRGWHSVFLGRRNWDFVWNFDESLFAVTTIIPPGLECFLTSRTFGGIRFDTDSMNSFGWPTWHV